MRNKILAVVALGVFAVAARLGAQQCPGTRPLEGHGILEQSQGTFDLGFRAPGACRGTTRCELGLGGRWLIEQVEADFDGLPYQGHGATSFDPATGKYTNVWIDSMSPTPLVTEGTYDPATKTLTFQGDTVMYGRRTKATLATVFHDADTRTFTFRAAGPDGKDLEVLHITYKRRGK